MKSWYVYILSNYGNTVLYVGITSNLRRRLEEHKKGKRGSFSKKYRLYKLLWYEDLGSKNDARKEEVRLKGLTRAKKWKIVKSMNPRLRDLAYVLYD